MSTLVDQRCVAHPDREAAVRCPECLQFYCRECVTEHLGRMMCAHCVSRSQTESDSGRSFLAVWGALSVAGLLLAWITFYYLGIGLARIPASFHGGIP
jgi:late competence protein required for DNA uptake (superfamily II DNA/RNA helicase)